MISARVINKWLAELTHVYVISIIDSPERYPSPMTVTSDQVLTLGQVYIGNLPSPVSCEAAYLRDLYPVFTINDDSAVNLTP